MLIQLFSFANAQYQVRTNESGNAYYLTPVFAGDYPDPSILRDGSLVILAEGRSVVESSPLLTIPPDHSYTTQVELYIEGEAIGGLVLFYNDRAYSGILADKENIFANLRGWQFPTEKKVIQNHVFLRLINRDNIVDMYYSPEGVEWKKIESSLEVSALHHNALGGFLSLRIGLCSLGKGKVRFDNFIYSP